jgi:CDP-glucose 4,6-dehydratase
MVTGKNPTTVNRSLPDHAFWKDKRVLVTGHTGFKGAWLSLWLSKMGAEVSGISLTPDTSPNLYTLADINRHSQSYFCDIRDDGELAGLVAEAAPEIVIHMAAQALVRPGYQQPVETFDTNVMGTVHLLESVRKIGSVRVVVCVTTDKVYRNQERAEPYRETDELGGYDPYSASKAASELVIASYRDSFLARAGVAVASARAGNVIGGGDWSEERLIPDAVRAWGSGETLTIRRPQAIRPWQHVLEPLCGYMVLAEQLWASSDLAGAYNFGPKTDEAATVKDVVELAQESFARGNVIFEDTETGPHEAGRLSLDISRAQSQLGYEPLWGLRESIFRAMSWYRRQQRGEDAQALCEEDINAYEAVS